MTIDERRRLALHQAAKQVLGDEPAVTLMEMLPPSGWSDVATRQDLDLLRAELRTEMSELRADVRGEMSDLRVDVQRALRSSLQWTITTVVAGFAAVSAAVALTR